MGNQYNLIFENLKFTKDYCAFEFTADSDHNIVGDCEITGIGVGIFSYGSFNLFTKNYLHDLVMVVDNVIPDSEPGGGDYGATCFWFYAPNNEVSYNRAINNVGHSYDYQFDGGFLEFYGNCDNTYAHHNYVEKGCGIMEASPNNG